MQLALTKQMGDRRLVFIANLVKVLDLVVPGSRNQDTRQSRTQMSVVGCLSRTVYLAPGLGIVASDC